MGREQDDAQFDEFVRATGVSLYRSAYLLTGDHHLAEDLTQATYAKAFASWSRVSRADDPVAYARTTLLNTYLSHRRLRRNSEVPRAELPDSIASTVNAEERLDLLRALGTLAPGDRAVLVCRYWEDRSVAQTAADLGVSEDAVRTRARRALARVRAVLPQPEGNHR